MPTSARRSRPATSPAASALLGRPLTLRAEVVDGGELRFPWPMAMPPDGRYPCVVEGGPARLAIAGSVARIEDSPPLDGRVEIRL